jgi:hypothetical protein
MAAAPGSCLAFLHGASDVGAQDMPEAERYNEQASAQFSARNREHVGRLFDGLETGPGLVNLSRWARGTAGDDSAQADVAAYCGLAASRNRQPGTISLTVFPTILVSLRYSALMG